MGRLTTRTAQHNARNLRVGRSLHPGGWLPRTTYTRLWIGGEGDVREGDSSQLDSRVQHLVAVRTVLCALIVLHLDFDDPIHVGVLPQILGNAVFQSGVDRLMRRDAT
eukprot:scaffold25117_cov30-Tisochrysis_lutea.AAC.3